MYLYLLSDPTLPSSVEFTSKLPHQLDLTAPSLFYTNIKSHNINKIYRQQTTSAVTAHSEWEVAVREIIYPRIPDDAQPIVAYLYLDIAEKSCVGSVQFNILRSFVFRNLTPSSAFGDSLNHLQFDKLLWFRLNRSVLDAIEIKIDSDSDLTPIPLADGRRHPVVILLEIRKHERNK